jgi:hypothetical protein
VPECEGRRAELLGALCRGGGAIAVVRLGEAVDPWRGLAEALRGRPWPPFVVVVYISVWNEFLYALVLGPSPSESNAQVAISTSKSAFQFNTTGTLAATTLVMLVPIVALLILERHVVHGLTAGASK